MLEEVLVEHEEGRRSDVLNLFGLEQQLHELLVCLRWHKIFSFGCADAKLLCLFYRSALASMLIYDNFLPAILWNHVSVEMTLGVEMGQRQGGAVIS